MNREIQGIPILVLRGGSGIGKSTLAKRLKGRMANGFIVETDRAWEMLAPVDWRDFNQYEIALHLSLRFTESLILLGRKMGILVGVGSGHYLERVKLWSKHMPIQLTTVTMWASDEVLKKRLLERAEKRKKIISPEQMGVKMKMNQNMYEDRDCGDFFLNTTNKNKSEVESFIEEVWPFLKKES